MKTAFFKPKLELNKMHTGVQHSPRDVLETPLGQAEWIKQHGGRPYTSFWAKYIG